MPAKKASRPARFRRHSIRQPADPDPSLNPLIVIPARMTSTRLPGKPLADIGGEPMIVWVWRAATAAKLGRVLVACAESEIAEAVKAAGGEAVLTAADHASGSDRVFEAVSQADPGAAHDVVVNLQGDLPTIESGLIQAAVAPLRPILQSILEPW